MLKLDHLPLRILRITYERAVELELDDEFIEWIDMEVKKREEEKLERCRKAKS
ncbi:sporulation histidine kinase inhibitor Sda [Halobacillus sp. Marseille-Q1614]|uniref:sporulation histidine kinase inhibitor Sda n=1 Tax=Halobacillus sp. Marseille-Q1614 TaxID=2709134 RepID=UPI00156DD407|nr:sporulation histidine kinase inhibitor Sda [Halobacillus sp. Marseille-Q1614]